MNIIIETEEATHLAHHLVHLTGEPLSQAVIEALRDQVQRIQQANRMTEDLLSIGRECAQRLQEPCRSLDHDTLLYDEQGLPA
ncbi:MAG: type II toxin-antitoxin system VapB family antitoxin [Magnetococcales bacterium]|nr:type II toxin-antitoxin system VapB family antitoxin [Magnetococcales bacterium]